MEYLVIVEQGPTSFGAKDEALQLIREAIELHLESLRENSDEVPAPRSFVERIAV